MIMKRLQEVIYRNLRIFFVFKDSFISSYHLFLLCNLYKNFITTLNILAASKGKSPLVVSPDVILASARSRTELVISPTSALFGLGLVYIDSNI